MTPHPFWTYSREVLAFRWPGQELPRPYPRADKGFRDRNLYQAMQQLERSNKSHVLLFGLGAGALAGDLAATLPAGKALTVCEAQPAQVQAVIEADAARLAWLEPGSRHQLLADSSPWALLVLLAAFARPVGETLCLLNPELERAHRGVHALVQQKYAAMRLVDAPAGARPAALSAAAMLRPDEPGLEAFFAQFPGWLHEVCVVWDAEDVPRHGHAPAAPLRECARPLGGDFAAQRNAMLQACGGDWVLYLDGDERLVPEDWARLPGLLSGGLQGYYLPRLTFYPDMGHCMAGLGLWPDLQLRLFRRSPGLRFESQVHERLVGVHGPMAALCAMPILHFSHVRKDRGQWREKLALYDRAAGPGVRHRRNRDYPRLEAAFFESLMAAFPDAAALLMD